MALLMLVLATFTLAMSSQITFSGVANNSTLAVCEKNTETMNLQLASLEKGDTFIVQNQTYCLQGGVEAENLHDVTIQLDGTLSWTDQIKSWPYNGNNVKECWYMQGLRNVTFTSSGAGTLYGNGDTWWGFISYLTRAENRPRLFRVHDSTNLLMEHWYFEQSPYWTTLFDDVSDVEIRHCHINNRRNDEDNHSLWNLGAFNTDGFDLSGKNVYIHDCNIWNQDDSICVKPMDGNGKNAQCSENWLVENVQASGLGLTIGSVGPSQAHACVRNITFANCDMHHTFKGIYIKSDPGPLGTAEISNILYENITMNSPEQWGFWLGPQQAVYSGCCSLLWPFVPLTKCPVPSLVSFDNLTFRNILIDSPSYSPGVILGNNTNPISNIIFDNVRATNAKHMPFYGDYYKCDGLVNATAIGGTDPVPPCFTNNN